MIVAFFVYFLSNEVYGDGELLRETASGVRRGELLSETVFEFLNLVLASIRAFLFYSLV
jgi:hypothetical protein